MFKKFNWGHGILLFFIIFVGSMLTVLWLSFGVDHSLVRDDYYDEDIHYQETFDKKQNFLKSDNVSIEYMNADGVIAVDFNESVNPNGLITMYRPSDKSLDYQVNIQSSKTNIPVKKLKKGLWRVKVDWKENDKAYYAEKDIFL